MPCPVSRRAQVGAGDGPVEGDVELGCALTDGVRDAPRDSALFLALNALRNRALVLLTIR